MTLLESQHYTYCIHQNFRRFMIYHISFFSAQLELCISVGYSSKCFHVRLSLITTLWRTLLFLHNLLLNIIFLSELHFQNKNNSLLGLKKSLRFSTNKITTQIFRECSIFLKFYLHHIYLPT